MNVLNELSIEEFFKTTWTKKATLYKSIFNKEQLVIDQDELAGMAMEDEFVSRIIRFPNNNLKDCSVDFGPFSEKELTHLSVEKPWSLLIQNTEEVFPNIKKIQEYFKFIPELFHDDVMGVISSNEGSSGPHIDFYSVFIVQVSGKKEWNLEQNINSPIEANNRIFEDLDLKILKDFKSSESFIMEPGDVLYIPPGMAHHAKSKGNSLSLSIGIKGPRTYELVETYVNKFMQGVHEDSRINFDPETWLNHQQIQLVENSVPEKIALKATHDELVELIAETKKREY